MQILSMAIFVKLMRQKNNNCISLEILISVLEKNLIGPIYKTIDKYKVSMKFKILFLLSKLKLVSLEEQAQP
ncbi:MAG: hypothetical protein ACI84K_000299 [Pseudohongiellaceae bacterium]|jgi:hypothetical protein